MPNGRSHLQWNLLQLCSNSHLQLCMPHTPVCIPHCAPALQALQLLLRLRPLLRLQVYLVNANKTDVLLLIGAIYYQLGNYQQCIAFNDRCILLDPHMAEAHANLANALQQLGNFDMAVIYYQVMHTDLLHLEQTTASTCCTTSNFARSSIAHEYCGCLCPADHQQSKVP